MQKTVSIGDTTFRIVSLEQGGQWMAEAYRGDPGERFGPPVAAPDAEGAIDRLLGWLEWQREHQVALEALQEAERAYHRMIAGSPFAAAMDGPSPLELQAEARQRLEGARLRVDEIRQWKPL